MVKPATINKQEKLLINKQPTKLINRPLAAKPSRDLLFIKLWAATLRMPEMEKAC